MVRYLEYKVQYPRHFFRGHLNLGSKFPSYMEKAMAPHSSSLAWKIPWMEEPGRLRSMGLLSQTQLGDFTFTFHFHALETGNGNPLQCSCLENPRDSRAWWAAVYGVAQSRTRLKRLSSSSSSSMRDNIMCNTWTHGT